MDRSFWIGLFSGLALVAFLAISGLFSSMSGVGHGPGQHMMSEMPQGGMFSGMMHDMAEGMSQPSTGNADADFLKAMIPHHEGAVEMANAVLAKGADPEVKALAEKIIAAQQAEISWMQGWLKAKGY
jgi:uncharacterized protein (DUF305 family)